MFAREKRTFWFLISAVLSSLYFIPSSLAVEGTAEEFAAILIAPERPTVTELRRYPMPTIESVVGPIGEVSTGERVTMDLYRMSIEEIRTDYAHRTIVVFGRDGEFFHDALYVTSPPQMQSRIFLIQAG